MKNFLLLSIFTVFYTFILSQGTGMMYSNEMDFGYGYCGGYGHRWMQRNLPTEYYKKFEDMIIKNRETMEKLYEEKYQISENIREELENQKPNWNKIENMIEKQKQISDKIWNIMKNEHLKIYKNLPYKARQMLNNTYRRNYRQGYRHRKRRNIR